MLGSLLSRLIIISTGLLYPAYSSFKTIRSANVKHYVRWMMYWTVFAMFTAVEYVADVFISWLPFYYEIKVIMVIWLMSSYTKGASIIYRKVLHPLLSKKEMAIDQWIGDKQEQSLQVLIDAGRKGVQAAASGALSGVTTLQGSAQNGGMQAATGILGSVANMVTAGLSSAAQPANGSATAGRNHGDDDNPDETFEEIDDTEVLTSSDEDDDDYEPPTTRGKNKND